VAIDPESGGWVGDSSPDVHPFVNPALSGSSILCATSDIADGGAAADVTLEQTEDF